MIADLSRRVIRYFKKDRGAGDTYLPSEIYSDDVFLVSYPKSGNTWVRFLLANALYPDVEVDFHTIHSLIPEVGQEARRRNLPGPRLLKSHAPFRPEYPQVIYIVRDGRDVYCSYFHYLRNKLPGDITLRDFLRDDSYYQRTWGEHVTSWLDGSDTGPLLLVYYEDLLEDCAGQLHRMADFIGVGISESRIQAAVRASSFERMRNIEAEKGRAFADQDRADRFMRKGVHGDWRQHFGPEEKKILEHREGDVLRRLGYVDGPNW